MQVTMGQRLVHLPCIFLPKSIHPAKKHTHLSCASSTALLKWYKKVIFAWTIIFPITWSLIRYFRGTLSRGCASAYDVSSSELELFGLTARPVVEKLTLIQIFDTTTGCVVILINTGKKKQKKNTTPNKLFDRTQPKRIHIFQTVHYRAGFFLTCKSFITHKSQLKIIHELHCCRDTSVPDTSVFMHVLLFGTQTRKESIQDQQWVHMFGT